jgi:hypothetical protein
MLSYRKENKDFSDKTGVACVFTSSHNKNYAGYNQLWTIKKGNKFESKTFAETLDQ